MKYELINVTNGNIVAVTKTENEARMIQALAIASTYIRKIWAAGAGFRTQPKKIKKFLTNNKKWYIINISNEREITKNEK